ncbi:FUSC family protein [Paraburkholderia sp. DHOC27]|uniref:FUSC family protein n=1 Tax=Paraburkholderia sp. DHOC27 TaxID=2303330 RepID=UPI000E3B604F|nr:FUSC family protein [Paraburkholderia sp. DHOC27]RFU48973.1 FUSC family protein [Paraburkholderia sp. DHOC27]
MTFLSTLAQLSRAAVLALGRELAAWKPSPSRASFAAAAVLSVALSVALANALNLSDTWWAAITGFVLMQTTFASSVERSAYRIMGTVIGAALGTIIGPWLGDRPWFFVPAMAAIGGVSVYQANGLKASYAWILGGVTALMVTYEAHKFASIRETALFAALRVAEVAVGTFSCLVVASLFYFGPKWYRRARAGASLNHAAGSASASSASAAPTPPTQTSQAIRTLLGVQAALSVTILAILTYVWHTPGFAQTMVTVMAVLLLPAGLTADITQQRVLEKMVQRVAGCLLAGALALALLPLMRGEAVLCMLALSIGVWLGCHVQTGREGASYVGRQFTIAFIIVFVQDHHWSADPLPALERLTGILIGIVVLALVMIATSKRPFVTAHTQSDEVT